jgi:hypothetical protein
MYILAINSTNSRNDLRKAKRQRVLCFRTMRVFYPILHYHFIGNPSQEEEHLYDTETNTVYLKCSNDIYTIAYKTFLMMNWIYKNHPDATGVLFTDIQYSVNLQKLYDTLEEHKNKDYYGHLVNNKLDTRTYRNEFQKIKDIPAKYENVRYYPVLQRCAYISRLPGIYLSLSMINHIKKTPKLFQELVDVKPYIHKMGLQEFFENIPLLVDYNIGFSLIRNKVQATHVDLSDIFT